MGGIWAVLASGEHRVSRFVARLERLLRRFRNHQLHLTVGRILDEPLFTVRGKAVHRSHDFRFWLKPTRWWRFHMVLGLLAITSPLLATVASTGGALAQWLVRGFWLLALLPVALYVWYFIGNLKRCENFTPALHRWYWLPTTEPFVRCAPWIAFFLVLALSVLFGSAIARESDHAILILRQPAAVMLKQPEAVLLKQPSAELLKQPAAVLLKQPEAVLLKGSGGTAVLKQPEAQLLKQPDAVLIKQPEAELLKQPRAELLRQPEGEIEIREREPEPELMRGRFMGQAILIAYISGVLLGLHWLFTNSALLTRVRRLEALYNEPERGWSSYERRIVRLVTTQKIGWRSMRSRGWRAEDDFSQQVLRLGMIEIFFSRSEDQLFKTSALFVAVLMGPVIVPFAALILLPIANNLLPSIPGLAAIKIHPGFYAVSIVSWAAWGIAYYAYVSGSVMTDLYRTARRGAELYGLPQQGYAQGVRRYFSGRGHAVVDTVLVAIIPFYVELFLHFLGEH